MSKRDQFIPLIHNYCDRWCERCRFIMRCRVGVEEIKRMKESEEQEEETAMVNAVDAVAKNLKNVLEMLEKYAKENGVDLEQLKQEIDDVEEEELIYTQEQTQLKEWGMQYLKTGRAWFAKNELALKAKEDEINQNIHMGIEGTAKEGRALMDAIEVIRWFLFFISVKMDRALHGLQSEWFEDDDPIQNDANGSAKVALDAIERSLAAWEVIHQHFPNHIDDLIDIFVVLGRMRKKLMQLFPNVKEFVRPGFDEPEFYTP